ncbi:MAG: hypothetical protein M3Z14_01465, partial [Candidatus Eremiobacteraeota bacterium]|nr:hypothetical protein [Candidatus Eremiobacteraeota bacterium]
ITEWQHRRLQFGSKFKLLMSLLELASSDVWYTVGAPDTDRFLGIAARFLHKPRVVHWVGSDIQTAHANPRIIRQLKGQRVLHLAEVDWTAKEVERFGFDARIAPLPPRLIRQSVTPMPNIFTLLLYLPRTRAYFYGRSEYERLICNLRHEQIRFLIVGGGALTTAFSAPVENMGYQDSMGSVYGETSALLRIPEHDGLSLMVLEALSFGRYVMWPQKFPFVTFVSDYANIEMAVKAMLERHRNGTLTLQSDACAFIAEQYDYGRCLERIADAWSDSTNRSAARQ